MTSFFGKRTSDPPPTVTSPPLSTISPLPSSLALEKRPATRPSSSPWKQTTPSTAPKKRLSLKRTRKLVKGKRLAPPTDESPGGKIVKQMRLDDFKIFTPTKLEYVLDRSRREEEEEDERRDGFISPDLIEAFKSSKEAIEVPSAKNRVKRNLFYKEKLTSRNESSRVVKKLFGFGHDSSRENTDRAQPEILDSALEYLKRREGDAGEGNGTTGEVGDKEEIETKMVEDYTKGEGEKEEEETDEGLIENSSIRNLEISIDEGKQGGGEKGGAEGGAKNSTSQSDEFTLSSEEDLDEVFRCISVNYDDEGSHDDHVTLPPRYRVTEVYRERYRDENNGRMKIQILLYLKPLVPAGGGNEGEEEKDNTLCYLRDDW